MTDEEAEIIAEVLAEQERERELTFRLATRLAAVVNRRGVPVFTPREVAARAIAVAREVLDQVEADAAPEPEADAELEAEPEPETDAQLEVARTPARHPHSLFQPPRTAANSLVDF